MDAIFGVEKAQVLVVYCDCKKNNKREVLLMRGIDPRFFQGECSKCKKIHTIREKQA
jgi:hypothetical protein